MPVTLDNLDDVFTYHAPTPEQQEAYRAINDAAKQLARVILDHTPACADQQAAVRLVREARMTANAAVALGGAV